jgi:hypothetical protein
MAAVARCAGGFLNGIIGALKTIIADAFEEHDQAKVFSVSRAGLGTQSHGVTRWRMSAKGFALARRAGCHGDYEVGPMPRSVMCPRQHNRHRCRT